MRAMRVAAVGCKKDKKHGDSWRVDTAVSLLGCLQGSEEIDVLVESEQRRLRDDALTGRMKTGHWS